MMYQMIKHLQICSPGGVQRGQALPKVAGGVVAHVVADVAGGG